MLGWKQLEHGKTINRIILDKSQYLGTKINVNKKLTIWQTWKAVNFLKHPYRKDVYNIGLEHWVNMSNTGLSFLASKHYFWILLYSAPALTNQRVAYIWVHQVKRQIRGFRPCYAKNCPAYSLGCVPSYPLSPDLEDDGADGQEGGDPGQGDQEAPVHRCPLQPPAPAHDAPQRLTCECLGQHIGNVPE